MNKAREHYDIDHDDLQTRGVARVRRGPGGPDGEDEGGRVQKLFAVPPTADSVLENRELVDKILATLPEDYRTILTLREADGLEYQEIAAVLNISLDAVKGRLARTRRYLQEHIQHFLGKESVYMKEGENPS